MPPRPTLHRGPSFSPPVIIHPAWEMRRDGGPFRHWGGGSGSWRSQGRPLETGPCERGGRRRPWAGGRWGRGSTGRAWRGQTQAPGPGQRRRAPRASPFAPRPALGFRSSWNLCSKGSAAWISRLAQGGGAHALLAPSTARGGGYGEKVNRALTQTRRGGGRAAGAAGAGTEAAFVRRGSPAARAGCAAGLRPVPGTCGGCSWPPCSPRPCGR